jgi:hypothetical protein
VAGDFAQVESKMNWARHQLGVLNLALADYGDLKPFEDRIEEDDAAECYRVRAHLRYPPPASLSHLVGDVLTNLHGVLDYLAWQLVIREGETPDRETNFPIIVKAADNGGGDDAVNIYRRDKERNRRRVPTIHHPVALGLLRLVQPYHQGEDASSHPLEVLRTLNNQSKHQHPVLLATATVGGTFMTGPGNRPVGGIEDSLLLTHRRVKHGEELFTIRYADAPNGCAPGKATFAAEVSLEDSPWDPGDPLGDVQTLLAWIAAFVDQHIVGACSLLFQD